MSAAFSLGRTRSPTYGSNCKSLRGDSAAQSLHQVTAKKLDNGVALVGIASQTAAEHRVERARQLRDEASSWEEM